MVLQAIQPSLHDIVYEMESTTKPIPLKGGIESLGNVGPAIGDNSREVHMQIEQMALLCGTLRNDYMYTTLQQLGNIIRRGEIRSMTEACKEYTHLDGQLSHPALHMIPALDAATPNKGPGEHPRF